MFSIARRRTSLARSSCLVASRRVTALPWDKPGPLVPEPRWPHPYDRPRLAGSLPEWSRPPSRSLWRRSQSSLMPFWRASNVGSFLYSEGKTPPLEEPHSNAVLSSASPPWCDATPVLPLLSLEPRQQLAFFGKPVQSFPKLPQRSVEFRLLHQASGSVDDRRDGIRFQPFLNLVSAADSKSPNSRSSGNSRLPRVKIRQHRRNFPPSSNRPGVLLCR